MKKKRDIRGVSLIELMVTLAIAGIVTAAIYEIYISIQRQGVAQEEIAEMQQAVRIATDQITKELRLAGYNGKNGEAPIVGIVGSTNIDQITLDKNNTSEWVKIRGDFDESNDGVYEEVRYTIDANSMLRRCFWKSSNAGTPCEWEDFVPNIKNIVFSFYNDQNGSVAISVDPNGADPSSDVVSSPVRRVSFNLTGMTKEHPLTSPIYKLWSAGYKTASLTSDAVLRNFGAAASDITAPACPTGISVIVTGNCGELQVTWSWADKNPPEGDLAGFLIYYQASNGMDTGSMTVSDPNARSAFLTNRINDVSVSYSVDVRAYDRYFNRNDTCDPLPYPTGTPTNSGAAPNPPDSFKATPGQNEVKLTWNPLDTSITNNRDVKGFRLYRGTTADFVPSSTNIIACEKIKDGEPAVTGCTNNVLSAANAETGWSDVTSYTDSTAVNCNKYYYIIRSVDQCLTEGSNSQVVSATPPDNDKKPNTPVITSLVAGDDTSSIIVDWTLAYDPADTTYAPPDKFKVFYKMTIDSTWTQWGADITNTLTGGPQTLTGMATLNGLLTNTSYDIKISAFDVKVLSPLCEIESAVTASNTGTISTAACAPKISWGTRGGHFIFPGITTTGTALANNSKVGTEPDTVANSRFLTWIVDPLDCTPDSSNYDRQGFDYNNPPTYNPPSVSPNARVEFFINSSGSSTDIGADTAYNDPTITQHVDTAPRASDNYYHWPTYPLNNAHIDTSRLCNGLKDFTIRAVDGEQYTAENTVILEIKNGGIEHNSSVATISNITTPNDYHNQVVFGLKNSSTVKDLRIKKMTFTWDDPFVGNTFVNLKKIEVFNSSNVLIGLFEDTLVPIDTTSGTEVSLTTIPTINTSSTATIKLTFTKPDGSAPIETDMRGKTLTLDSVAFEDNTDPGFTCSATSLATLSTSSDPVAGGVKQNKPAVDTTAKTTTGIQVASGTGVEVSLPVTDATASVASVSIQYAAVTSSSTTAPTRPSSLTEIGNYPNLVAMTFDSISGLWKGTIPSNNDLRVWYFIEAVDSIGNADISPDTGAYTYAQCGTTPPTAAFSGATPANGSNVNNIVTIEVTVSSTSGISNVFLFTDPNDPVNQLIIQPPVAMVEVSSSVWKGSYNATAGNLKHLLKVTATNNCGIQTTISRTFN